ncbi:aconitate hydratase AcnA [Promicromonospora sukumoe]|uniref:aconitate hydratase AcnA n=1 Tax=Promicromonospora sukumoe TaxID=88382 RepID=UPI0037CC2249
MHHLDDDIPLGTSTLLIGQRTREAVHVDLPAVLGEEGCRLPVVLRLLAENIARRSAPAERARALAAIRDWVRTRTSTAEVEFWPSRVLMHDTTSTPALVDIAALRDAVAAQGGDARLLNPVLPVEVSIDHSLAVEEFARADAPVRNMRHEVRRNRERYRFLRWAAGSMSNVHVNPPGTGIMHTINLEQLATVVTTEERDGRVWLVPDMMIGTDSHTPMINGLGVLGWGAGGLEAQTVTFGMPMSLRIPDVVGVRLTGALPSGALGTDLALTVTQELRALGVTGEFVEFYGPGVSTLSVGTRAVVANMAPEYGATTGYFPVDERSLDYLRQTGRGEAHAALVRDYCVRTGLWFDPQAEPVFTRTIEIDLSQVETSVAGPRRPQDRHTPEQVTDLLRSVSGLEPKPAADDELPRFPVAIASITSCTNTTDPALLIAAGLLARNARRYGLDVPHWVKTSLAPGSPTAATYLHRAGLTDDLAAVGFDIVGFGCATCIGNSGALTPPVLAAQERGSAPVAILSGNRNFPGRVHPDLDLGFLMSPPLVVAFALAGDAAVDITTAPLGTAPDGTPVHLADIWPDTAEIEALMATAITPEDYARDFAAATVNPLWSRIEAPVSDLFPWDEESTTLVRPPFADDGSTLLGSYTAHPLLVLGDDVTTDHISPASAIPAESLAADYLVERGEPRDDLNVFASRRGNWEVMVRGAYFNRSLRNALAPDAPPAHTVHAPSGEIVTVFDAAARYAEQGAPVVVIAGERYGMGSSRDWAAKVQRLLGVRAVLASGFERIHRSNLVGMGVLPLVVPEPWRAEMQSVVVGDTVHVDARPEAIAPHADVEVTLRRANGSWATFTAQAAIETAHEVQLLHHGGVIPAILSRTLASGTTTRDRTTA